MLTVLAQKEYSVPHHRNQKIDERRFWANFVEKKIFRMKVQTVLTQKEYSVLQWPENFYSLQFCKSGYFIFLRPNLLQTNSILYYSIRA